MLNIDLERFKQAILEVSEVTIDFTELTQNIQINHDGNFESNGSGTHVILSPNYEVLIIGGGVSKKASNEILNKQDECDKEW